jgi:HEAT repeat protein
MFGLDNFALDRVSFWLGFIGGTLFWLLINRLWKGIPFIRQTIQQILDANRRKRMSGVESALRQDALRRAQRNHLSASLFSLDEILVEPHVLAPPPQIDPQTPITIERYASRVLPFLPEFPQFAVRFGSPRLTIFEALQGECHIALLGDAGSGKSTALAYLTSAIARQEEKAGKWGNLLPVYLHILDLDFHSTTKNDLLEPIIKAVSTTAPVTSLPQIPGFIRFTFQEGNAICIFDGLDELSKEEFSLVHSYLKELTSRYPSIRIVVTASNQYMDGLNQLAFEPFVIAGWTKDELTDFINRWGVLWNNLIGVSASQQQNLEILDNLLVTNWLGYDPLYYTPLQWTLKVWGAYAGDLAGDEEYEAISAFLNRLTQYRVPIAAMGVLADAMLRQRSAFLEYSDAEKSLSSVHLNQQEEEKLNQEEKTSNPAALQKEISAKPVTSGGRILSILLDSGILTEHQGDRVRFSSPVWTGYLAATQSPSADFSPPFRLYSSVEDEYYHYMTIFHPGNWLESYLQQDESPFYTNLLNALRWIKDTPSNHPARSLVLKICIPYLQNEMLPYSLRSRILAGSVSSNDPALTLLFKQFLNHTSPTMRSLAALGCGAFQDSKTIPNLISLLNDESPDTRISACFALACFENPDAERAIIDCIHYADETLRLAAAETLSLDIKKGHAYLKELVASEDLLVRRSAVFGLSLIQSDWVVDLLEKIAVEDSQWVVRNAAGQALENLQKSNPFIPQKQKEPADTSWLIAFAAKRGLGISKGDPAIPLLFEVLANGSEDEKIAALWFLRHHPQEKVISQIYPLLFSSQLELRDTANFALWFMSLCNH